MKTQTEHRKAVLAKHPKAVCERDGVFFFISHGKGWDKQDLGAGFSREAAWNSAAITMKRN